MLKRWLALVVGVLLCGAPVQASENERDLTVYTSSAPDPSDPRRIIATMHLLNHTPRAMQVRLALDAQPLAGLAEQRFHTTIDAREEARWEFHLLPADSLQYEVLHGSIWLGEAAEGPDRELYLAVQGPDPQHFSDKRVQRITDRAQVVGTHAPRTKERIGRLFEASTSGRRRAGPAVTLAAGGRSRHSIECALLNPDETARSAAQTELADAIADLRRCVQVRAGVDLPLVAEARDGAPAVRIRRIDSPADWPHPEAYRLRTQGDDVIIESPTFEGLRNGIYGLLSDHFDCHWFMPKQLGEEIVVAADRSIALAAVDEIRAPSFASSIGMSWGHAPRWDRQNRSVINRGRMTFGHAWAGLLDRNEYPFDRFPEMWSRDRDGNVQVFDSTWSSTNFCSTHPQVLRVVADKINAKFDAEPEAIVASLDPNDLAPLCQCDRCLAVDASYGVTPQDDKQMADRLLHFSKEIHDRLEPEHKEKFLGILAYGFQVRPPKQAIAHPRHATIVCDFPSYFDHTRPFADPTSPYNREFHEIVKGWSAKVKQLGFYDYYGHYNFFGPWGILHKMGRDLATFRELGGTFVVIESQPNFAMHGLNLYVAAQLAWNVEADVDLLVEQYVTKFYGPAAEPMRDFFRAAERHYALTRPGTEAALRVAERAGFWEELDAHLRDAARRVEGLSGDERRFADRIAFHRDGFAFARRAFQLPSRAGDVDFLRQTRAEFDRMKAKYASSDDYWPTMIAPYFYPDVDAMLERSQGK